TKVLIIKGEGTKAFAAGTDIKQFKNFTGKDGVEYEKRIDSIVNKIEEFPKPTIALINGYAVGGGWLIAMACDLKYATTESKLGDTIAKTLGNCLSFDNYERCVRSFREETTKELIYTADLIKEKNIKEKSFLSDIFEKNKIEEQVLNIAKKIQKNAPLTIKATKSFFNLRKEKRNGKKKEYDN